MQRLVDDLLDLSRIESGGWQPEPRTVNLEGAAREAWTPFTERAASSPRRDRDVYAARLPVLHRQLAIMQAALEAPRNR